MRTRTGSLAAVSTLAAAVLLIPAGAAQAKLTAKVSVTESSGVRLQVVLASTTALSSKARPRSVRVRAGSTTFTLTRSSASAARTVKLGTWRTGRLTGTRATRARALRGKAVSVLVRSRAGRTTTLRRTVTAAPAAPPAPTAPAPTTPAPAPAPTAPAQPFTAPGQVLTGQAAIDSFGKYFFNSQFSDCFAGRWPACTVEERYDHFENGGFTYRRCTPTSGSDINYVSSYQIVGAQQNADGSWVVEYRTQGNSFQDLYHWEVGQNGIANGYYVAPDGGQQQLLNYQWRQPAYAANCYGD